MLLRVCSWHRLYKGYPWVMGIKWGFGEWGITGGLCRSCLASQRLHMQAKRDIAMSGCDS
jgi:hypothetical protein